MSRAEKTPNEFNYVSDVGIAHVLQSTKKSGGTVDDIVTRLKSWKSGAIDLTYIDKDFHDTANGKPYFQNPYSRDDEELKKRLQNYISGVRKRYETVIADTWLAAVDIDGVKARNATLLEFQSRGEFLDRELEPLPDMEALGKIIEEELETQVPTIGHHGDRKSTQERKQAIAATIKIDLSKLSRLSVIIPKG